MEVNHCMTCFSEPSEKVLLCGLSMISAPDMLGSIMEYSRHCLYVFAVSGDVTVLSWMVVPTHMKKIS